MAMKLSMHKQDQIMILLLLLLFLGGASLEASMGEPEIFVNHKTKQCGEFSGFSDCGRSNPSGDWTSASGVCPSGYQQNVKIAAANYEGYKSEFCCSESHSGGEGSCQDLVVNKKQKLCAFVASIANCKKLPKNWNAAQAKAGLLELCPREFKWQQSVLSCSQ
jgi:hypothetical protein